MYCESSNESREHLVYYKFSKYTVYCESSKLTVYQESSKYVCMESCKYVVFSRQVCGVLQVHRHIRFNRCNTPGSEPSRVKRVDIPPDIL